MGRNVTKFKDQDGNVYDMKDVVVRGELPKKSPAVYEILSNQSIASFTDGANGMPLKGLTVGIEPVQDLHGQDSPYPAGGGKNLVDAEDTTVTSQKTVGTLTADAGTYSFSCHVKDTSNIGGSLKISLNGTLSKTTNFVAGTDGVVKAENVSVSSDNTAISIIISGTAAGYNYQVSEIQCEKGSSATDYAPYENICPITGWTGINVTRCGKNLWNGQIINGESEIQGLAVGETYTVSASMINPEISTYLYLRKKVPGGSYTTVSQIIRNTTVTPGTFTVEEGDTYALWANASYTNVGDVQIEKGSSASTYEEYSGTTIPVVFPALGKNLFNKNDTSIRIENVYLESGTGRYSVYGLTTRVVKMLCKPSTSYVISNGITTTLRVSSFSSVPSSESMPNAKNAPYVATQAGTGLTITTGADDKYLYIQVFADSDTGIDIDSATASLMVSEGTTVQQYEPYTNTAYSGTLDLTTGELTVDKASVDLGSISWSRYAGTPSFFYAVISDKTSAGASVGICSIYPGASSVSVSDKVFTWNGTQLRIRDDSYSDVASFTTAMSGNTLVYPLATPVTYQLTPVQIATLLGQNNLWADTGDVISIEFPADTLLYIQKKIAETQALALG